MKIFLRDRNPGMTEAWNKYFQDDNVNISCGDIFMPLNGDHMKAEAIVSPANSFGFMDGGIDYIYSLFFGWGMSEELRTLIHTKHDGEILVGDAEVVDIRKTKSDTPIPWLIAAPTMRVPEDVSQTVNAYLAFRAVLRIAKDNQFDSILCPGLGTAVGQMPYEMCALQMYEAYLGHKNGHRVCDILGVAHNRHFMMKNYIPWNESD